MLRRFVPAALLFCAGLASAQNSPTMINLPDSPLHFVSITMNLSDFLQDVKVKNVSGKQIVGFQLGLIMTVPAACGPKEVIAPEQIMLPDRVDIAPGASEITHSYRYSLDGVRTFGTDNHAREVHTQLTVIHVDFADGTSWSLHRQGKVYDEKVMRTDSALQCPAHPR